MFQDQEKTCDESQFGDDSTVDIDSPDSPATEKHPEERVFRSPQKKQGKKRKIADTNASLVDGAFSILQTIQTNQEKKQIKDEYALFGEQVAMKMRKLVSPHARFTVQNKINYTLFEAEMGWFNGNGNDNHRFPPSTIPFTTSSYTTNATHYSSNSSTPTLYSPSPQSMTPYASPSPSRTSNPTSSVPNFSLDGYLNYN